MSQIAERANVSVAAVSVILKGDAQRQFSSALVSRVQAIAEELDYTPNLLVRSMQRGRTHILTLYNTFRHRSHDDHYMSRLMTALELAATRRGYDLLISCVFGDSAEQTYKRLNGGYSDGLILYCPGPDEPLMRYLRNSRLPTLIVNRVDPLAALSHIKDDVVDGIDQAASRLVDLGHRRVAALISHREHNPNAEERVGLMRRSLLDRGVRIPERWVLDIGDEETTNTLYDNLQRLMSEPEPPTAIFCWHDELGYKTLECCERLGIGIPNRLSIIGYDGLPWPGQKGHKLAAVQVDLDALGDGIIGLMDELVGGEVVAPVSRLLPVSFDDGTTLGRSP